MAKIHTLKIKNFRGIKEFEYIFGDSNFICLIGRGDSGKTTILNAINAVLYPGWNYVFDDTDFFNGNVENPIEIEVSLIDLPNELLTESKFGLYKRLLNSEGQIIDDVLNEDSSDNKDVLTIRLVVEKDLEPKWFVTNNRDNQEDIEIRAKDRAKLNVFMLSDYMDRHFTWSKSSPLYSLLKENKKEKETDEILAGVYRELKNKIDEYSIDSFNDIIKEIKESASNLGLTVEEPKTTLDFKNTFMKEGNIVLYENNIPLRLRGKGSKRLLSIAIQLEAVKQGGIILIDEIEQSLEPDRARFLVKQLKKYNKGQIFITTHSSDVISELSIEDIFLIRKEENKSFLVSFEGEDFQKTIRKNPQAFFAKKILVCEGATEIGICRSLNDYLIEKGKEKFNLATLGIVLADGTGSNLIKYTKKFKEAGFDVCLFCDSDVDDINNKKQELKDKGITIVDCEEPLSIEQQLFNDLPWNKIKELIDYTIEIKSKDSIEKATNKTIEDLKNSDTPEIRNILGKETKGYKYTDDNGRERRKDGWYKRIDHGEFLGKVWFESLDELDGKKLKEEYEKLVEWIRKK